jgi:hypothetical protein
MNPTTIGIDPIDGNSTTPMLWSLPSSRDSLG